MKFASVRSHRSVAKRGSSLDFPERRTRKNRVVKDFLWDAVNLILTIYPINIKTKIRFE